MPLAIFGLACIVAGCRTMSGYAFANTERAPDFLRMTIELGAACCLRKPFTPDALLTSVNQCITTPKASARHSK